jgi:hypothetical protein
MMESLEENHNTVRRQPLVLQLLDTEDGMHNLMLSCLKFKFASQVSWGLG